MKYYVFCMFCLFCSCNSFGIINLKTHEKSYIKVNPFYIYRERILASNINDSTFYTLRRNNFGDQLVIYKYNVNGYLISKKNLSLKIENNNWFSSDLFQYIPQSGDIVFEEHTTASLCIFNTKKESLVYYTLPDEGYYIQAFYALSSSQFLLNLTKHYRSLVDECETDFDIIKILDIQSPEKNKAVYLNSTLLSLEDVNSQKTQVLIRKDNTLFVYNTSDLKCLKKIKIPKYKPCLNDYWVSFLPNSEKIMIYNGDSVYIVNLEKNTIKKLKNFTPFYDPRYDLIVAVNDNLIAYASPTTKSGDLPTEICIYSISEEKVIFTFRIEKYGSIFAKDNHVIYAID